MEQSKTSILSYFQDIDFPRSRQELIDYCEDLDAPQQILQFLECLPNRQYYSLTDLMAGAVEAHQSMSH